MQEYRSWLIPPHPEADFSGLPIDVLLADDDLPCTEDCEAD